MVVAERRPVSERDRVWPGARLSRRVAEVRAAAERAADGDAARPGRLMQRAAAGLARRCALALRTGCGGVYGRRVAAAGRRRQQRRRHAATPARCWPGAGVAVRALLLESGARPTPTGLAALPARRRARSSPTVDRPRWTWCSTASSASAARGAARRRRSRWCRPSRRCAPADGRRADRGRASTCPAGSRSTPARSRDRRSGPTSPSRSAASSRRWWSAPAAPLAGQVDLVDIGLARAWPRRRRCRVPDVADIAALAGPAPGADVGQVHPRRGRAGDRLGRPTPVRRSCRCAGRARPARPGWSATPATAAPTWSGPHPSVVVADRVADAGRVQAWVCGCGLGTDERAQDELRAVLGAPVPAGARRGRADAARRRHPRRPGCAQRDAPTGGHPARPGVRPPGRGAGRCRTGSTRPASWRPGSRATVLLKGDRTVVATPGRDRLGQPDRHRRRSPPPAPATCWPACWSRCSPAACRPTGPRSAAAYVHGLAGRAARAGRRGAR